MISRVAAETIGTSVIDPGGTEVGARGAPEAHAVTLVGVGNTRWVGGSDEINFEISCAFAALPRDRNVDIFILIGVFIKQFLPENVALAREEPLVGAQAVSAMII